MTVAIAVAVAIGDGDVRAIEGTTVVNRATGSFGGSVAGQHGHPGRAGPAQQFGGRGLPADQYPVEGGQRRSGLRVAEDAAQLQGNDGGVAASPGHRRDGVGQGGGAEAVGKLHGDGNLAGPQRPQQHLQPRDVRRRRGQQPLTRATETGVRGVDGRAEVRGREHRPLGGACRAGRAGDDGDVGVDGIAGALGAGQQLRAGRVIGGHGQQRNFPVECMGQGRDGFQGTEARPHGQQVESMRNGVVGVHDCQGRCTPHSR